MILFLIALCFGGTAYLIIITGKFPVQAKPLFPIILFMALNWFYAYIYFTKPNKGKDDLNINIVCHIPVLIMTIIVSIISSEVIKSL